MSIAVVMVISIVLIVANILYIHAILTFRIETAGTYVKYNTVKSCHGTDYEPVFRYYL